MECDPITHADCLYNGSIFVLQLHLDSYTVHVHVELLLLFFSPAKTDLYNYTAISYAWLCIIPDPCKARLCLGPIRDCPWRWWLTSRQKELDLVSGEHVYTLWYRVRSLGRCWGTSAHRPQEWLNRSLDGRTSFLVCRLYRTFLPDWIHRYLYLSVTIITLNLNIQI